MRELTPSDRHDRQENVEFARLELIELQRANGEDDGANTCGSVEKDEVGLVEKAVIDHGEVGSHHQGEDSNVVG